MTQHLLPRAAREIDNVDEDAMRVRRRTASQRRHHTKTGRRPDPKKARQAKKVWRKKRAKMTRALRKFSRSATGRAFHAKLGRFNSHDNRQAITDDASSGWESLIAGWQLVLDQLDQLGPDAQEDEGIQDLRQVASDAIAGAREEAEYRPEPEPDDWQFLSDVHGDLIAALRDDSAAAMVEAVVRGKDPGTVLREAIGG